MAYVIVLVLSLLVGGAVYLRTVHTARGEPAAVGFDGGGDAAGERYADSPGAGYTYLRVATRGPSWQDRLQGFVGLILLLAAGAAALAFGIYQLGHLISVTIERFLHA